MAAGVFGYLGYDMVRLMEELPAAESRSARPSRRDADAPDAHRGVRRGEGQHHRGHAGAARAGVTRAGRATTRAGAAGRRRRRARPAARQGSRATPMPARSTCRRRPTPRRTNIMAMVRARQGLHRAPATSSRWCCRSASRRRSRCRRSRSTARCAASTRRRSCSSSTSATSRSPARARRSWCGVRDGTVTIRPIAGTRPRGATPDEDKALEDELLADPKERAEHLMLLDLGRNDVGRVAEIGTVTVTDQFFIERYSHVMHIVSNVEGELAASHDALDALAAGFPAGTVSGAPKVRAMEIIDELEKEKRGLYAGCVGYFARRRRDGHLHRAAHRAGQGRHDVRAGRRRHRRRQRSGERAGNASTRPRRCSAPPRRRGASPARPGAGSRAADGALA